MKFGPIGQSAKYDSIPGPSSGSRKNTATLTSNSARVTGGIGGMDSSAGAGGRNRTGMVLPPADFESAASTDFATPAVDGALVERRERIMACGARCHRHRDGTLTSTTFVLRAPVSALGAARRAHARPATMFRRRRP